MTTPDKRDITVQTAEDTGDSAEAAAMGHLEETLAEESGSGRRSGIIGVPTGDQSTPTTRKHISMEMQQVEELLNAQQARYQQLKELGTGGSAIVVSAHDAFFDRDIAAKILHQQNKAGKKRIERFMHEARMTARLEHPNILPVFDMQTSDDGACYFTMRKAEGVCLRDAIAELEVDPQTQNAISAFNDRINIFIKICDAVAYAHDKGIIHRDIKPENVMLGRFGEVVVVDWGSAVTHEEAESQRNKLVGTPAYMAPEQARREVATERSDIYCLGATLYQLLTLRHVMWSQNQEEFWKNKREGVRDELPEEVRRQVPPRLLAIADKALSFNPSDRYASVVELIDDIKHYQSGLSVTAYQDTVWDLLRRWYSNNKKVFWISSVALVCILMAFLAWYNEKLKEMRNWRLYAEEDFDELQITDLAEDWQALYYNMWNENNAFPLYLDQEQDRFQLVDDQLLLRGKFSNGCYNLSYRKSVGENIKVSWDLTPQQGDSNFNCYIGGPYRHQSYIFHVAGHGSNQHIVLTRPGLRVFVGRYQLDEPFQIGQTYQFEMVKENENIALYIDGVLTAHYRDLDVLTGPGHQQFGFEMSTSNYLVDNIKIYTQPLPQKVSPLAVPHAYYQDGFYVRAMESYESLRTAYPGTEIEWQALLYIGRCQQALGNHVEAQTCFEEVIAKNEEKEISGLAIFDLLVLAVDKNNYELAIKCAEDMKRFEQAQSIKRPFFIILQTFLMDHHHLSDSHDWILVDNVKQLCLQLIKEINAYGDAFNIGKEDRVALSTLASRLNDLGEHELVLKMFPDNESLVKRAMQDLGRGDELLEMYPDDKNLKVAKLASEGRHQEIEALYPNLFFDRYRGYLFEQGRYDEVIERYHDNRGVMADLLLSQGKYQEVYENYKDVTRQWISAAMNLGHYEEIAGKNIQQYWERASAMHMLGREEALLKEDWYPKGAPTRMVTHMRVAVKAMQTNKLDKARKHIAEIEKFPLFRGMPREVGHGIIPFIKYYCIENRSAEFCREWFRKRAQVYQNKFDNSVTRYTSFLAGDLALTDLPEKTKVGALESGIRSELQGETSEALAHYMTFVEEGSERNTGDLFAKWRIAELKQQIRE